MRMGITWVVAGLAMSAGAVPAQEAPPPVQPPSPASEQPAPAEPPSSPPDAAPAPVAEAPPAIAAAPFKLLNTRKVYKQKWRVVNLFISACDYGVYGYGEQLVGGRQERLDRRLRAHFGDRLNGHEVVLERYEFFQNAQINLIRGVGAMQGGLIGGAISSTYNLNCKRKDTKSGWYDTRMFPPDPAPYVVEITVKVDGQVIATSAAASPARAHTFKEADLAEPEIAAVIEAVQEVAIDDLIKRMDPLIPQP